MNKRGLSAVVTTLIIILLVIVSIAIIWVVINNVISQGAEEISLGKFTVDAEIENVVVDNSTNNISLNVKRKVGQGNISGIKFIFYTNTGSESIEEDISLQELETRNFNFHLNTNVNQLVRISIVPIFTTSSEKKVLGNIMDTHTVGGGGGGSSSSSCTANCTGRVCGNDGCGGSCGICSGSQYCSSGTCIEGTNPCDLTTASWDQINVYDGTVVSLNLTGTNCTGIDINFSIYEDDILIDDYVSSIVSSFSSTTWTSHWTYSGDDDSGDDQRDYYFIARVLDNPSESVTSGLLNVSQTACTPDCSCASTTCTGSTCSDGCGGTCPGTLAPDCGARECGAAPNGCGTANQCGTCSGSDVCVSGTCQSSCTPAVNPCGSYECGLVQNGTCGNVSCGTCSGSETCVGGSCVEGIGNFVADYSVAKESVLRSIPTQYINYVRDNFVIAYQHSSHGTHVSRGIWGLEGYKTGDDILFSITSPGESWAPGMLDFRDHMDVTFPNVAGHLGSYSPDGSDCRDLTVSCHEPFYNGELTFVNATRAFLEDPVNSDVNVIMWSWCNVVYSYVNSTKYLEGMQTLIDEYGEGGSNPRALTTPVQFVFMTGHSNADANTGPGEPAEKAQVIVDYCEENGYFCLDYYSIDTHDMSDTYWDDTGDNGDSAAYGGNFYEDWQNTHTEGVDWYRSINEGGTYYPGAHNTQYITANRKAYAFWWIMSRLAGWDGVS